MANRLAHESSLYLRQHAGNPVDWFPWGDEAFDAARATGRPVLLSIGYSSCHWCHVMAHESFEDPATAAVMNELFVCVKVDREERPDVDALYMQATLALAGHGGWPMTVWLTPDRRPFYAGTYFPPTARGGLPGFADMCRGIADAWAKRPGEVDQQAAHVVDRIGRLAIKRTAPGEISPALLDDAVIGLARAFDPANGGFGGAPKFPPSLALEFMLRRAERHPDEMNTREMAELTLRRMADGGVYDQVGGGFHRYSVDAVWLVPHFEKMLYDNALLARVYAQAHRLTGDPDWRRVAEETLDYLLREMRAQGAFAAAQDADSPGGEGAFFVWGPEDLHDLLTEDEARAVTLRYGVTAPGNFEGRNILHVELPLEHVAADLGQDPEPLLASARGKLYAARSRREAPARDDKVIASWNGLAIAAFADAGVILGRPDFVRAAEEAAAALLDGLVVDGRLHRTLQDGAARHLGQLDDHADLAHGLLQLYAATFAPRWLIAARDLADRMIALFHDGDGEGGFFYSGSDGEALVARTRDLEDHPTPGGNSQAAWVLLRLAGLTGDGRLLEIAEGAVRLVRTDLFRFPHAFGTALVAADHLAHERREIAIAGDPAHPATIALIAAARTAGPGTVIACGRPDDADAVAASPLLADRPLVDGAPAAYVCVGSACRAPVTDPGVLRAELAG
ncbi:MAG: thioredoxin domain-containing protein [Thermoleophilia bacterium]|nr:thioredoxin domain-containing protein [Thermoleophilia bacterium]